VRYLIAIIAILVGNVSNGNAQRPIALLGSRAKLEKQNRIAVRHDLSPMRSREQIRKMARSGRLVPIASRGVGFYIDPELERGTLTHARPWVANFLAREGGHFDRAFPGARFKVTSLVRTIGYQRMLQRRNVNAARCDTPLTCSPHLTGSTLDISKKSLSSKQIRWMRNHLVALQRCNQVIAIEERVTNAFHVFVLPTFGRFPKNC